MRIVYTDFGIAYAYNDVIEINRVLLKYPVMMERVLEHEKKHLKNSKSFIDWSTELNEFVNFRYYWLDLKFLFQEPIPFFQSLMPIFKSNNRWCYNAFLCVIYLSFFVLGMVSVLF